MSRVNKSVYTGSARALAENIELEYGIECGICGNREVADVVSSLILAAEEFSRKGWRCGGDQAVCLRCSGDDVISMAITEAENDLRVTCPEMFAGKPIFIERKPK